MPFMIETASPGEGLIENLAAIGSWISYPIENKLSTATTNKVANRKGNAVKVEVAYLQIQTLSASERTRCNGAHGEEENHRLNGYRDLRCSSQGSFDSDVTAGEDIFAPLAEAGSVEVTNKQCAMDPNHCQEREPKASDPLENHIDSWMHRSQDDRDNEPGQQSILQRWMRQFPGADPWCAPRAWAGVEGEDWKIVEELGPRECSK